MNHREKFFDEKMREIGKEKIVVDVGGGTPLSGVVKYKDYFKDSDYKSLDCDPNSHPDIVGDVHDLPFNDESVDAIICKSVLQFVYDPHRAVGEIHRVLRKGGKCFISVPFLYPYHGGERRKDYYRYTAEGIKYLFRDFEVIEICPYKGYFKMITNFLPNSDRFPMNIFVSIGRFLDKHLERYQSSKQVWGHYAFFIK